MNDPHNSNMPLHRPWSTLPSELQAAMSQMDPSTSSAPASFFNLSRMREALKKYGRTGVVVYLGISFTVTAGWYIAIERHVDVKKLLRLKDDPGREPSWFESLLVGKGSNLALAILCSKFCVPIKVPMAVAITPYVHRWSEQVFRGFALSKSR